MSAISESPDGVILQIHVQPRASRTEVAGPHGDAIKIRLQAPPVDGAANAALIEFIAGQLGVRRADVSLVAGESSRRKILRIRGLDPATAGQRLGWAK